MKQNELVADDLTIRKLAEAEKSAAPDSITKTAPVQDESARGLADSQFVAFLIPIERIREAMVANLGDSNMSVTDLERIRIPTGGGSFWTVPDIVGEQTMRELSGVILAWRDVRMYWKRPMEQSVGAAPPDCYAPDARTGIGDPGGSCRSCRFAQFGSAAKGDGQACKLCRQLFLLRPGNLLPDIVNLPAGSLKSVHEFLRRLAAKGRPCYSLRTHIALEKTRSSQGFEYSRARFTAGEDLSPEEAKRAKEYATMLKPFIEAAHPEPTARTPQKQEDEAA
jgi:hypothetical protein